MHVLIQDLDRNRRSDDPDDQSPKSTFATVLTVRYAAVLLFRLASAAGAIHPVLGSAVKQLNHLLTGADIAWNATIGPGLVLWHPTGVVIGPGTRVGRNCGIQQGVTLGAARSTRSPTGEPVIGDDVYLGAGCRVLGSVRVGDAARVGANSVVLTDVAASTTVVGAPARPI